MSGTEFKTKFGELHGDVLHNDQVFNTEELENDEEIKKFIDIAYDYADTLSPTGSRSPHDVSMLEKEEKQLKEDLLKRKQQEAEDNAHSASWRTWADSKRKQINDSVKRDLSKRMTRLHEALKDPKIKDILLEVMNRTISKEQAFDDIKDLNIQQAFNDIKANPSLKNQMMSLTLKGPANTGGKSRVFRRKNKKTTSTSRRNARRTRRHRKSSTRRSTRK
jgi:hypothetical protein